MEDVEIWKPVVGFEQLYEVSNFGRIKTLPKKGFKKIVIRKTGTDVRNGYVTITLRKNNIPITKRIHSLVVEAFLNTKTTRKLVCNHKDGNKTNNKLSNLEIITQKENVLHAIAIGKTKIPLKDERYNSKIKEKDFQLLKDLFKQGLTSKAIAKQFNVCPTTISRIRKGERRPYLFNDDIC
jgi:hypothetical protein